MKWRCFRHLPEGNMLSEKEILRYSRHLLLSEIGTEGQEKLKNARVVVIGAGGLGCPVLQYLAAAGVGRIGIVDFDVVDETNLQRQILFDVSDIGKSKAETAKIKLQNQNPLISVTSVNEKLITQNALSLFSEYDIIIDGTDNFSTRYMVNDACVLLGKTLVSGSVFKFQGQVSVFNFKNKNGEIGPTYRCLFPTPPSPDDVPSCSEVGVLGVLPGIIGTLMANESLKIITGIGEILSGKLLIADALSMNFNTIELKRNPASLKLIPKSAEEFQKMDYEFFCGTKQNKSSVKEISAPMLFDLINSPEEIQLLDVREPNENPFVEKLNDLKIPLGNLEKRVKEISRNKKVIVFCRSGIRSRKAIELLQNKFGFENLLNLKGGVMEWLNK